MVRRRACRFGNDGINDRGVGSLRRFLIKHGLYLTHRVELAGKVRRFPNAPFKVVSIRFFSVKMSIDA